MTHVRSRMHYIDHIRSLVIILVVFVHAGVTYSGIGRWYYVENSAPDVATGFLLAAFLSFTQAFSMGLLFWIAGYFAASSCDRKGIRSFLADRAVRLGIPTLLYMLLINPLLGYILAGLETSPPFSCRSSLCAVPPEPGVHPGLGADVVCPGPARFQCRV